MTRIDDKFIELRSKNERALIAYMMAGYPTPSKSLSIFEDLINGGADMIEIGFPFSDPLADGPVIQKASSVAINLKTDEFFTLVQKLRKITDIPLIMMTYSNILYTKNYSKFIGTAVRAGIDGFILPDMPIEESDEYVKAAKQHGADTIFLVSPNTSKKRLAKIVAKSTGFLYLVAVYGTTGGAIKNYSIKVIQNTKVDIPLGVGFGVSTSADVKKFVQAGADAIIVGSALLRQVDSDPHKVLSFMKSLKDATKP